MQSALKKQHRSITVNTYKYMALLTLISVNGLSISQLEIIMETLHAMKLNTLPFMMHLGMFAMIRKEKRKKSNYLHSRELHSIHKACST